jgi:thioesterase-3
MNAFKKFTYKMLIREHHLDSFHHVNNATYLEIFEEARWELLQLSGITLQSIHANGIGPVVLECHLKFIKELRLRETIVIESQLQSYEKVIGVMQQNIIDEQGKICCQAQLTFGVFDLQSRKLILPPPEWLKAIGAREHT